jgi:hypothetical protein
MGCCYSKPCCLEAEVDITTQPPVRARPLRPNKVSKPACRPLPTPTSSTKGVVCHTSTNTELGGLVGPECQSLVPEDGPADENRTPWSTSPPGHRSRLLQQQQTCSSQHHHACMSLLRPPAPPGVCLFTCPRTLNLVDWWCQSLVLTVLTPLWGACKVNVGGSQSSR